MINYDCLARQQILNQEMLMIRLHVLGGKEFINKTVFLLIHLVIERFSKFLDRLSLYPSLS